MKFPAECPFLKSLNNLRQQIATKILPRVSFRALLGVDRKSEILKYYFYFWCGRVGKWTKYKKQWSLKKLKEPRNKSSVACVTKAKFRGVGRFLLIVSLKTHPTSKTQRDAQLASQYIYLLANTSFCHRVKTLRMPSMCPDQNNFLPELGKTASHLLCFLSRPE